VKPQLIGRDNVTRKQAAASINRRGIKDLNASLRGAGAGKRRAGKKRSGAHEAFV
jgi:hypothetical protein